MSKNKQNKQNKQPRSNDQVVIDTLKHQVQGLRQQVKKLESKLIALGY